MLGFSVSRRQCQLGMTLSLVLAGLIHGSPRAMPANTNSLNNAATVSASLLDTALIRKLYLDGDFDQAIENLEAGLKEKLPYNHEDSVFIFKHLGVMYAAKYETREKGKYFMHQLLTVEPTARILDMYASDMIYMIFKNIQDEFDQASGRLSRAEAHVNGNAQKEADKNQPTEKSSSKKTEAPSKGNTLYWVGGSTLAIAAGVTAYLLLADQTATDDGPLHDVK
jgi:hypothetical protein